MQSRRQLRTGLGKLCIYWDSRSALQALCSLVPRHRAITERIETWLGTVVKGPYALDHKAHMGYAYNEHVDEATTRSADSSFLSTGEEEVLRSSVYRLAESGGSF